MRRLIVIKPVIQIAAVETDALIADRKRRNERQHGTLEHRPAHTEIGRCILHADHAGFNSVLTKTLFHRILNNDFPEHIITRKNRGIIQTKRALNRL